MRDSQQEIDTFIEALRQHAIKKSKLYDGADNAQDVDTCLRYAAEELGEVATAITRKRTLLAKYEAIDLAHCAMLVWFAIERGDS